MKQLLEQAASTARRSVAHRSGYSSHPIPLKTMSG